MSALCLSAAVTEIVVAVATLILVVNALAMMARVVTPGEAVRNSVVAICLLLALAALCGVLQHLWEGLTILEKMGVAVIGPTLVSHVISWRRAPRGAKTKVAH